ncbi:hypothetical protein ABZ313_35440 [Streptomyces sp. NPDC006251]|uniref:hypothetical protein n=1 Tax=Streptomyces sp. NPDC006251 TaxID=3155718 RepID=UPI0033B4F25F
MAQGKRTLPADADVGEFVAQLQRALHTIECRELGPAASAERFGPFADTGEGLVVLAIDADQLLARHVGQEELLDLVRAVRERGPAVDVTLVSPRG